MRHKIQMILVAIFVVAGSWRAEAQLLKLSAEAAQEFLESPVGTHLLEELADSAPGKAALHELLGLGANASPKAQQGYRLVTEPRFRETLLGRVPPNIRDEEARRLKLLSDLLPQGDDSASKFKFVPSKTVPDLGASASSFPSGIKFVGAVAGASVTGAAGGAGAVVGKKVCDDYQCGERAEIEIERTLRSIDLDITPFKAK